MHLLHGKSVEEQGLSEEFVLFFGLAEDHNNYLVKAALSRARSKQLTFSWVFLRLQSDVSLIVVADRDQTENNSSEQRI